MCLYAGSRHLPKKLMLTPSHLALVNPGEPGE